jgi:DNA-binding PadR family transcriptional regulator
MMASKHLTFIICQVWQFICLANMNQMEAENYLGEFEELVLLMVAVMNGEAYGAAITQTISERTGRSVQVSAVHVALCRLEEKGLIKSMMGGATKERGGRRKRIFFITVLGRNVLQDIRNVREQLWSLIPKPI